MYSLRNGAPLKERNKIKFHRSLRGRGGYLDRNYVINGAIKYLCVTLIFSNFERTLIKTVYLYL